MKSKVFLKFLIAIAAVMVASWAYASGSMGSKEPTSRSDRLFKPFDDGAYRITQKIERGQAIGVSELKALPNGVNMRYGQEITLLFHALSARNDLR